MEAARRGLAGTLVDKAEACLLQGEVLPQRQALVSDPEADLEEPIHLLLQAATHVTLIRNHEVA